MTLAELLTELRENILHDRSDRASGTPDYLWSDATLVRYIDEAQRRFARQGLVIRDGSTPEVTQVTLQTGVSTYTLHPSILAVISARLTNDRSDLARTGHSALDTYRQPDSYFFDPAQLDSLPAGKPLAYTTDEQFGADDFDASGVTTLRVYPEPTAQYNGQVIRLRVVRLPLDHLTVNCSTKSPEIPEIHHLDMLDWAAYLALRIVDVDAGWTSRAIEFRQSFEATVAEARRIAMRKMFAPAHWGFGRNGFSWER